MKRLSLVVCTLILLVARAHGQTPIPSESLSWTTYTIKGEDFAVDLPVLPAMHKTRQFVDRLQKSRTIHLLGSYADGVVYTIDVFENPQPRQSLEAYGAPEEDPRVKKFLSTISLHRKKESEEVTDGPGAAYEPKFESGASNWAADQKLFTGKEVNKKARLGMKPEPAYTEEARQNGTTGTVVLKCVFASNGSITNIRVVQGLPFGLTERAIDAARKIKFIPAMKDGHYVSMWMQLEYNFNLY